MPKSFVILLATLFAGFGLRGQAPESAGVVLGVGMQAWHYVGDFNLEEEAVFRTSAGIGLHIQGGGQSVLKVRANLGYFRFRDQFDGPLPTSEDGTPNKFVESDVLYGDLQLRLALWPRSAFYPWFAIGAGLMRFDPRDPLGDRLIDQPQTRAAEETYNRIIPYLPASAGVYWQISYFLSLDIGYSYVYLTNDYIDNIGQLGLRAGNDALHNVRLALGIRLGGQP